MEITEIKREDSILYQAAGRIDTNTSIELKERLLNGLIKYLNIVLDLEQVSYVSSAGLRVLLIAEKTAVSKGGSFEIVNVQPPVMEVFQMTGFDNILNIKDSSTL